MKLLPALTAIIGREVKRMLRQRGRLVAAMVRPLMWFFIIGSGFHALLEGSGRGQYKLFMVPGLICMVMLFAGMLASLSLVYDKESGVMRMLIIAPFAHFWIVLARTISAAVAALIQASLFMLMMTLIGYLHAPADLPLFLLGLLLTALTCASAGMLIAVFSKTMDNFAVIMNFVIFPMFFLSGALYPLAHLPAYLRNISLINPFSYCVDLLKHALLKDVPSRYGADLGVSTDIAVLLGFIVLAMIVACVRFSQRPVRETLTHILSASKPR